MKVISNRYTPLVKLVNGDYPDREPVQVLGRITNLTAGSILIADGTSSVWVKLHNGSNKHSLYDWVSIMGAWIAGQGIILEALTEIVRVSKHGDVTTTGTIPEEIYIRETGKLQSFYLRSKVLGWLRRFMEKKDFLEVTTPVLHAAPEACHVNQLSLETASGHTLYLRTDPEEYLKRYLTAGLPAVFEISTNFRCERPSSRSLQEFTSMECYQRMADFEDIVRLLNEIFDEAMRSFGHSGKGSVDGSPYHIRLPFTMETFDDLIIRHTGISLQQHPSGESLAAAIRHRGWWNGSGSMIDNYRRTWIEWLFDNRVLPALNYPVIVTDFPIDLGLSAAPKPSDPDHCFRGELYFPGGFEVAHFYYNLTEEETLRRRYENRRQHRIDAGMPVVPLDEGLMKSAALGMPPMGGIALGIERFMMILFEGWNIEDGLLFPREGAKI